MGPQFANGSGGHGTDHPYTLRRLVSAAALFTETGLTAFFGGNHLRVIAMGTM